MGIFIIIIIFKRQTEHEIVVEMDEFDNTFTRGYACWNELQINWAAFVLGYVQTFFLVLFS